MLESAVGSTARVARAAIRLRDGRVFSVRPPGRHGDVATAALDNGVDPEEVGASRQGFVTQGGVFLDREQAARVARRAGQINRTNLGPLFSEADASFSRITSDRPHTVDPEEKSVR